MAITRREFLQKSGLMTGAVLTHQAGHGVVGVRARPALARTLWRRSLMRCRFRGSRRARGWGPTPRNASVKIPYYRMAMRAFETKVHRDMKPTRMWGFGGNVSWADD